MCSHLKQWVTLWVGLITCVGSIQAHTPYLLPNSFSTSSAEKLTAISSFTEEFFVPDFKVESDDFHLLLPDGSRVNYSNVTIVDQLTVLETGLDVDGTYLLSTGNRLGRKFKMKRVDGAWDYLRRNHDGETEEAPEGVETADFQSQTVAVAYVTKGAPTAEVLSAAGVGLELVPVTHPSEVYFEESFELKLLFNGEPLSGHELNVFREGGSYEEPKYKRLVSSDEKGIVSVSFDQPGVCLIMTRHQGRAPEGSEAPYRSYTIALTFEAIR